jgi:hypothetical protein
LIQQNLLILLVFWMAMEAFSFRLFQRPDYKIKFQIRSSIAFYQDTKHKEILDWLKEIFGSGCIRHRKTGISDYTIVDSKEVKEILELLRPYVKLKSKQIELGLEILKKLEKTNSKEEFLEICKFVDKFKDLNYSKKRTITYEVVKKSLSP